MWAKKLMKRFLISILIIGFAGGVLFSISAMNHSHNSPMDGDCPMSSLNPFVCPTGVLSTAVHYLSMYQAFTNGLVSSAVTQVLMAVLLFIVAVYAFRNYLVSIRHLLLLFCSWRLYNFDARLRGAREITRWLSLLVNSPSLI